MGPAGVLRRGKEGNSPQGERTIDAPRAALSSVLFHGDQVEKHRSPVLGRRAWLATLSRDASFRSARATEQVRQLHCIADERRRTRTACRCMTCKFSRATH